MKSLLFIGTVILTGCSLISGTPDINVNRSYVSRQQEYNDDYTDATVNSWWNRHYKSKIATQPNNIAPTLSNPAARLKSLLIISDPHPITDNRQTHQTFNDSHHFWYGGTPMWSNTISTNTPSGIHPRYTPPTYTGGGSVHVQGYFRKNGTYVHAYTRSAPYRR